MLFSEFVNGTGCKDNEHNHEVFRNLEIMYMNSDMTKDEIYEYGKKLVDNSKSEETIRIEQQIRREIEECKETISYWKADVERYQMYLASFVNTIEDEKYYKQQIKNDRAEIRRLQNKIKALKWVIA